MKEKYKHDLENKKFGRLTAIRFLEVKELPNGNKVAMWECLCECGQLAKVIRADLTSGHVKSCGCLLIQRENKGKLCRKCGKAFQGGPNAQYCPECRILRKKEPQHKKSDFKHDLENKKFGKLTALRLLEIKVKPNGKKVAIWECQCDCGKVVQVIRGELTSGHVKSCGCLRSAKALDIKGKIFTRLTPLYAIDSNKRGVIWRCRCDCGNLVDVYVRNLITGDTQSCGCLRREILISKMTPYRVEGTNILMLNDKPFSTNTSGVRGVWWDKRSKVWVAEIIFKRKKYHLGRYDDIADAAKARKEAEVFIWGDFLDWYNSIYKKED